LTSRIRTTPRRSNRPPLEQDRHDDETRFADAFCGPPGQKSRRPKRFLDLVGVVCSTLLFATPLSAQDSKTAEVGKVPVKFQFGVEYSVVSQETFGQETQIKLNIIPVIPSLMKHPILGG
jgi:hypothetical protein